VDKGWKNSSWDIIFHASHNRVCSPEPKRSHLDRIVYDRFAKCNAHRPGNKPTRKQTLMLFPSRPSRSPVFLMWLCHVTRSPDLFECADDQKLMVACDLMRRPHTHQSAHSTPLTTNQTYKPLILEEYNWQLQSGRLITLGRALSHYHRFNYPHAVSTS
jgi:hypothetical protein